MHFLRILCFIISLVAVVTLTKRIKTSKRGKRNRRPSDTCDKPNPAHQSPVLIDLNLDNPLEIHNISKNISAEHVPGFHLSLKLNIHVGGRTPQEQKEHAHAETVISKLGQDGRNQMLGSVVKLLMPIHDRIQDLMKEIKNYLKLLTAAAGNVIVKISALLRDFAMIMDNLTKSKDATKSRKCKLRSNNNVS